VAGSWELFLGDPPEQSERQELLLLKRTLETAYNWYDDYVNPAEPLFDTPDFFFPLAGENLPFNLDNRLKGELLPVYITEYGLKILRDYSRWLAAFNAFALNALENRVSYVVGKGFGYTAVPAKSQRPADRILCHKAQEVIDDFLERTDWGELEQEVMRRADRDGEAFLRFFHTGNGECTVRTVEPEHVRSPGDQSAHLSFGVETPEHDIQDALAYWIVEEPSLSWTPSRVPADEVVHIRFNVDRTAKRGYPTLVPVRRNLLRADKLLQNMSTLARVQATFALIRKHKQYSPRRCKPGSKARRTSP
jgi:capsid protein